MNRRLRHYAMDVHAFAELLAASDKVRLQCPDLPSDAVYRGFFAEHSTGSVVLSFSHPTFADVPTSAVPARLPLVFA